MAIWPGDAQRGRKGGGRIPRGNGGINGWDGASLGTTPPQPYGWEEGIEIGNDPNWDSPQRKNEPRKESPEGGKGDRDHQPPQAGGDATDGWGADGRSVGSGLLVSFFLKGFSGLAEAN